MLEVRDLSLAVAAEAGLARILDRVSLRVGEGEVVGLVGESGCGKTTLARAILGVQPANAVIGGGSLRLAGEDLLALPPAEAGERIRGRLVTLIPQDPLGSFSPVFTVGDQITELMRWKSPDRRPGERGYPAARRRADRERVLAMLRAVQLPDPDGMLRKYPHEVSGGQRQRLMIAMALLPEPRLVIADEPTTALDVTVQAQVLKLLRALASSRGASVLFTTHDMGVAWEICDRVTVMYAGQDMESAPVDAFFAAPANPYTRLLLDSLPTRGSGLTGIPGTVPNPFEPPGGCRFHPRCPRASAVCGQVHPAESRRGPGHAFRCHHPLPAEAA